MPPCSWIASRAMYLPDRAIWSFAREAMRGSKLAFAIDIAAYKLMLRASSSDTYISAAR
jgi:hypothetical protein